MFRWLQPVRTPLIVAHRGSSAVAPENTLAAFRQALQDGADAVELDVRITRDGELVVFHDSRLERTTNGHGRVRDYALKDLKKLSAGARFHRKFVNEKIPTLPEVFESLGLQVGINVEIKADLQDRLRLNIADRCCQIIREYRVQNIVLLSSFIHRMVRRVKAVEPEIPTGYLAHPVRAAIRAPILQTRRAGAEYLILSGAGVRKRIVRNAHRRGLLVAEYTVNTSRRMDRSLRYGVDAIFTDNPVGMRHQIDRS